MLTHLSISNIVLIEKLNLEFGAGLNILTGETGAGKSILMDALALALGARSDVGLVRHGCEMASVTAEFDTADSELQTLLNDNGIEFDGTLILRRTLSSDGKSRAWAKLLALRCEGRGPQFKRRAAKKRRPRTGFLRCAALFCGA